MSFLFIFVFLIIAGFVAGLLSSIAGLASLASYPALLLIGLPPVLANVTNTTALVFTGIGSLISSLKELHGHWKKVMVLTLLSTGGSILGSLLLLLAPAASFEKVVPFFILFAGILLLSSSRKNNHFQFNFQRIPDFWLNLLSFGGIFLVGGYTGYFGAAGGVITLAILLVIINEDFATVNAVKNLLGFACNLIAAIIFIFKTKIDWTMVIPLGIGLLIGGYVGPVIVRHANIHLLRILIALAAFGLAAYLFITAYF
ncbi:sulfite exporter TauE/SafE family protein [Liquorilactobacillus sicerae]|uniref:sulfite exporter TauE/SafE family protein n=1 Tax=Liquorilactobacillus sicerae TaxID=1416943 RepID=UPI00247FE868|nr:sulfite exporter TauE/SafE family protein [Liquorilactobacillus sicerae]